MNNSVGESSLVRHSTPADLSEIFFFFETEPKRDTVETGENSVQKCARAFRGGGGRTASGISIGEPGFCLSFYE